MLIARLGEPITNPFGAGRVAKIHPLPTRRTAWGVDRTLPKYTPILDIREDDGVINTICIPEEGKLVWTLGVGATVIHGATVATYQPPVPVPTLPLKPPAPLETWVDEVGEITEDKWADFEIPTTQIQRMATIQTKVMTSPWVIVDEPEVYVYLQTPKWDHSGDKSVESVRVGDVYRTAARLLSADNGLTIGDTYEWLVFLGASLSEEDQRFTIEAYTAWKERKDPSPA